MLAEFPLVVNHLGEAEEVVAEVETVNVEADFTLPADQRTTHGEVLVGFLKSVEDFHKELLVFHNVYLFVF